MNLEIGTRRIRLVVLAPLWLNFARLGLPASCARPGRAARAKEADGCSFDPVVLAAHLLDCVQQLFARRAMSVSPHGVSHGPSTASRDTGPLFVLSLLLGSRCNLLLKLNQTAR